MIQLTGFQYPMIQLTGFRVPTIVPKPCGQEIIWADTELYVGKILRIKEGHSLSLQYHEEKDETIYVLSGKMQYRVLVSLDQPTVEIIMTPGMAYRNTPGTIHQMIAITDCDILEASTPHLNDVIRLQDRYGRV